MTDTLPGQNSELSGHQQKRASAVTIACRICQALYTPSHEHGYLLQAPASALESALMSMCHFCFRCRRPACPQCWDNIHGICGECCVEAGLPFRAQAAPLRGVLFATTRQAQLYRKHANPVRLRCIRPGRFQAIASIDTAETLPQHRAIAQSPQSNARRTNTTTVPPIEPKITHPPHLQNPHAIEEIATRQPTAPITAPTNRSIQSVPPRLTHTLNSDEIATRSPHAARSEPIQHRLTHSLNIDEIGTQPPPLTSTSTIERHEAPTSNKPSSERASSRPARLERVITLMLLFILIIILLLILLALLSAQINTQLQQSFQIDIRAELTYLWHLIGRIHF